MKSSRASRRGSTLSGRSPPETPSVRARRILGQHRNVIAAFKDARRDLEAFGKVAADPAYGALMSTLRRAAVERLAYPDSDRAYELLRQASLALDVPLVDLQALSRVPSHLVATGSWRPRSINVDLVEPDDSTRVGPQSGLQKALNKLSDRLPDTKDARPAGLYPVYMAVSKSLPTIDLTGRMMASPLFDASAVVHGWSDEMADDVQKRLREIHEAMKPSGISKKDLKALHPIEQEMALICAEALSGRALEAEMFVEWARDPDALDRPDGITHKMKRWASDGLEGLARFLNAAASSIRAFTDMENFRTMSVHIQFGGGIEKFWISSRAGATIMFPTLEQVERDGEAVIKVVSRVNPVDTLVGGMTLTSRGGGVNLRAGPIGAKVSDFEHEVKGGIPGIIGIAVGEDYAYGPVVAFGYAPPVGLLNIIPLPINIRVGGEVKLYHQGLLGLTQPTRAWAEQISIGCDAAHRGMKRAFGKEGSKLDEDGWPATQRWGLAKRAVARAVYAEEVVGERLAVLRGIEPDKFTEFVGPERAELLGNARRTPAETHETITNYLQFVQKKIARESQMIRDMAADAVNGEKPDRRKLKRIKKSLQRSVLALEWVDNLLYQLLVEPQFHASSSTVPTSSARPPHRDRRDQASTEVAS